MISFPAKVTQYTKDLCIIFAWPKMITTIAMLWMPGHENKQNPKQ